MVHAHTHTDTHSRTHALNTQTNRDRQTTDRHGGGEHRKLFSLGKILKATEQDASTKPSLKLRRRPDKQRQRTVASCRFVLLQRTIDNC